MMATLVDLVVYLANTRSMVVLGGLVLAAAISGFPKVMAKCGSLPGLITIVLLLMLKDMPWLALISGFPSTLSLSLYDVMATLLGHLIYMACMTGTSYLVLIIGRHCASLVSHSENKCPNWLFFITIGVHFMVMDLFMKQSSVSDMTAALLGLASSRVGMMVTPVIELLALSFLLLMGLAALVSTLLPLATGNYPKLMFANIVGLSFMVMKYMFDMDMSTDMSTLESELLSALPSIFSGTKVTLLELAGFIDNYQVACLVMRYLTVLALILLTPKSKSMTTCSKYTMAAFIVTLGIVLTMQPPAKPVEKHALTFESRSSVLSSTLVLGDFIRFSEAMRMEQRMAMEKLIEESKETIQSLIIHVVLILVTLIGGMVLYVRDQYLV